MKSALVERFLASMAIDAGQWRDGEGYDVAAIDEATRAERLSLDLETMGDVLREADWLAREAKEPAIGRARIGEAIARRDHRADRPRERINEAITRGGLVIDLAGARVGQINGLTVARLGQFSFGWPTRITASVRMVKGEVIDIEREVELGGPIHSKGVLILSGFLGQRYGRARPLSLSASIVLEQSYGEIDGDSASAAELCAVLSAIGGFALRQDLAVTGSVNQHGDIQPIGGVNQKIEGFFEACRRGGLSGTQGVIIPAANLKDLMLDETVVASVAARRFHVHAARRIDEVLELLTGEPAGRLEPDGAFTPGSLNRRIDDQLRATAESLRGFSARPLEREGT